MAEDTAVAIAPGPAAGADAGGSGGDAGGGSAPASQSDEQILGMDPVGTAPASEPVPNAEQVPDPAAAAAKPADGAQKTPEQQAAEAAATTAEDSRLMPVKWRDLAKSDPEFRSLFYTSKANAEKLAAIEPKYKEFETAAAEVARADQAYLSGDPVAIQGELKTFLGEKPEALLPMYQAGEALLKELNPTEYQRVTSERVTSTLKEWRFDKAFEVLRNALDAGDQGNDLLRQQVEKMLEFADGNGFPTTEKARVESRARELDERERTARVQEETRYAQSTHAFRDTVQAKVKDGIQNEIKTSLDKLLEKAAFSDGAKARIAADAYQELNTMVAGNAAMMDQVTRTIWPGGAKDPQGKPVRGIFNDANRDLAIKLPVEYAKSVLQDVIKKVVENYTKDFMASQQTADKRMAAAAGKTEVSGGTPAPRGRKPLTSKDIDYSKMDDNAILDA